jgi:hypothetical protein
MTVFKRYIDLECTAAQMKEVTSITIPNGVEINVDFRQSAWFFVSDYSFIVPLPFSLLSPFLLIIA